MQCYKGIERCEFVVPHGWCLGQTTGRCRRTARRPEADSQMLQRAPLEIATMSQEWPEYKSGFQSVKRKLDWYSTFPRTSQMSFYVATTCRLPPHPQHTCRRTALILLMYIYIYKCTYQYYIITFDFCFRYFPYTFYVFLEWHLMMTLVSRLLHMLWVCCLRFWKDCWRCRATWPPKS